MPILKAIISQLIAEKDAVVRPDYGIVGLVEIF